MKFVSTSPSPRPHDEGEKEVVTELPSQQYTGEGVPALTPTPVVPPTLALPPAGHSSSSRHKAHPRDKTAQVPVKSQDRILRSRYYLLITVINS